jgi:hypothetical protein
MTPSAGILASILLGLGLSGCQTETAPLPPSSIVAAGWSFGFCIGLCRGDLRVDGVDLSYQLSSRSGEPVNGSNRGRLTAEGAARLESLSAALPRNLMERYGCPDCADGGASFVTVARESASRRVEYEYRQPPPELEALDAFLASLMDALTECRSTADVTVGDCMPYSGSLPATRILGRGPSMSLTS